MAYLFFATEYGGRRGRFLVVFARSLVLDFQVNVAVSGVVPLLRSAEKYLAEGILRAGKSYFSQIFAFNSSEKAEMSMM